MPFTNGQRAYGIDVLFGGLIRFNINNPREYKISSLVAGPGVTDNNFVAGDLTPLGFYVLTRSGSFIRIDTATGAETFIATLASTPGQYFGHSWSGLAWNPVQKQLFAVTTGGSANALYKVDLATGRTAQVVQIADIGVKWIAFNNAGSLFGFTDTYKWISRIDRVTGDVSKISDDIGLQSLLSQLDGGFDPLDGKLYMSTYFTLGKLAEDLRVIDTATGKVTVKGSIGSLNEVASLAISRGNYKYAWSPSLGLSNSNDANPVAKPSTTTTYTLTVTDMCGSKATDTVKVIANAPKPTVNIVAEKDSICIAETSQLSATKDSNYLYTWLVNGKNVQNNSDSLLALRSGKYQVTVTNGRGGCANASKVLTVKDCSVWFNNNNADTVCSSYFYPPHGRADTSFFPGETYTKTIYPSTPGSMLTLRFDTMVLNAFGGLIVYDGPDISSPVLQTFQYYNLPKLHTNYYASSGPLTFKLASESRPESVGTWDAVISCYTPKVFRSKKSGNMEDISTWQVKTGDNLYADASSVPIYSDDSVIIQTGHTVTYSGDFTKTFDQLWLQKGAKLICKGPLVLNNAQGYDLVADGDIDMQGSGYITSYNGAQALINGNITGTNISMALDCYVGGKSPQTFACTNCSANILRVLNDNGLTMNGTLKTDSLIMNTPGRLHIDSAEITTYIALNNGIIDVTKAIKMGPLAKISVGSSNSYINGALVFITYSPGVFSFTYPVGNAAGYKPVTLNFQKITLPFDDQFRVRVIDSVPPVRALPAGISKIAANRYYKIECKSKALLKTASVTLPYTDDDGVTDATNLRIVKDTALSWMNAGGSGTQNTTGTITSANNFSTLGDFVLANAAGGTNTLPVTWLTFTAALQDKQVLLQWNVANEINSAYYNVEHSTDGIHFITIAKVTAYSTSKPDKQYSWLHTAPVAGLNYYRIAEVDKDNRTSYSKTINVQVRDDRSFAATPNPAHNVVNITAGTVIKEIYCYAVTGQLVKKILPAGRQCSISIKELAVGMYTLRVVTATGVFNAKIIKE